MMLSFVTFTNSAERTEATSQEVKAVMNLRVPYKAGNFFE
jgi:hypothetical protein